MRRTPRILTIAPGGLHGVWAAVAASRAGALGILDLAPEPGSGLTQEAVGRVASYLGDRPFGVRMDGDFPGADVLRHLPRGARVVVVSGRGQGGWEEAYARVAEAGRRPVAEVRSRGEAEAAVAAGFNRLIVTGHEAGGFVGAEPAFILLQAVLARVPRGVRVWVRGGIGPATATGCVAGGAAGVVLDGALWLARESPLPEAVRERVAQWDGVETSVVALDGARRFRGFAAPGSAALRRLFEASGTGREGEAAIRGMTGWDEGQVWPSGQDVAFAAGLARRFATVGGIVRAVDRAISEGLDAARDHRPLAEGSPLAVALGTRFPIVQGPMTRVSDRPDFAGAVAEGGALPFLALALMRGEEVRALLRETADRLGGRPWGVGLLGFAPPDLRDDQGRAVLEARPPFALIAGGRPDQSAPYERAGITTFLHAPSPGLLARFVKEGARRFVLEGRECGGHVGPRSSFVLWEQAGRVVLDAIERGADPAGFHLLYAGGVHDARSAAVVAAVAAPLAARGVKIGVLVGTAYLFTQEATEAGAIVPAYQDEAVGCGTTVLLETGPGHQVRVSPTPFAARFESERQAMLSEGRPAEEVRAALEALNVGRLRVAAKGVDRLQGPGSPLVPVSPEAQRAEGLYMLGQVATLRGSVTTIDALHREIAAGGDALVRDAAESRGRARSRRARPSDVAIVGMAAFLPAAGDVRTFWENTLRGRDAIVEVPPDRWDWRLYFDPDPKAPDKIVSRWGGFVPDVPFDPLEYGMPPASIPSIEPLQLLTLEAVRAALADAGYRDRPFPRDRTAVVLGAGGGAAQLAMGYAFRSYLPLLDTVAPGAGGEAAARCAGRLPEWTEDSFPGILLNVAAGRVANRFDLGGSNYTVDAACGSSLAAAAAAVRELETGAADVVILGGVDTVQNPFTYLAFSKTHAFSPRGRCRPFDAGADGIVISEGVAVVVLKRLADAERDGDRIYAVVKGLGSSSDGRAKGLTAPNVEGQVRALRRAYEKAGLSPATVGYVEAHGTGTAAGDLAEVNGLKHVFTEAGAGAGRCALGSVKSLIGHTKCAAGLAGLLNAALALHHRVYPPTIGVETPNPKAGIDGSPFHLSTQSRPWLRHDPKTPRRAGVSAFGFGGTNFHAVLEAYEGDPAPRPPARLDRPAELFVWKSGSRAGLAEQVEQVGRALRAGPTPALRDLADLLARSAARQGGEARLAVVATNPDDLIGKLDAVVRALRGAGEGPLNLGGVAFAERAAWAGARLAFLFPGQGSQASGMLGELTLHFPEVVDAFDEIDSALAARGFRPVGPLVYGPPTSGDEELQRRKAALAAPDVAQPALAAASLALVRILAGLGIEPGVLAGHSFGELVALHAAGVYPADSLAELAAARGRFLLDAVGDEPGGMAAVHAGLGEVEPLLVGLDGVVIANENGPRQTVVSGPRDGVARVVKAAGIRGLRAKPLAVACGFHSPLVAAARGPLEELAARRVGRAPARPVYSNANADVYPDDPAEVARRLGAHVASPVRFAPMVRAMHDGGARVFVEVGPGSVLTSLVGTILGDRPHLALACEPTGGKGVAGLLGTVGRLFVAGVTSDVTALTAGRATRRVALDGDRFRGVADPLPASAWLVNGSRARPANAPEPPRLGPGPVLPKPAIPPARARVEPPSATARRIGPPAGAVAARSNGHAPHPNGYSGLSVPQATPPPLPASRPVMEAYQATMRTFLDVQRTTMLRYLGGAHATCPPSTSPPLLPTESVPGPVAEARHDAPPVEVQESKADPAPAAPGLSRPADVEARLLSIVRDRTGYPEEMLRPDLDLEADLGIDSIKRVEILGSLRDALPGDWGPFETELMDQLSRARTLGSIVERVSRRLPSAHTSVGPNGAHSNGKPGAHPDDDRAVPARVNGKDRLRRMTVGVVDAPLPRFAVPAGLPTGGVVLVTDDGRGVARAAAARLAAEGLRVLMVTHELGAYPVPAEDRWAVDLTCPERLARLVEAVRGEGMMCGLLHLLPLRRAPEAGLDAGTWAGRVGVEARGLYLIARAAADDLARSAASGSAALVAATGMGGGFASVPGAPDTFFPGHGAVAGLVKTLAREWDGVRTRVVDVDPETHPEELGEWFAGELLTDDARTEVGYLGGRRVTLRAAEAPLGRAGRPRVEVRPGEPILITGGARGITAAVARDLAARWRPTLLLVGSSPAPGEEDPGLAGLSDPAAVKAVLLERLRRSRPGQTVGPAEVEKAYRAYRVGREIRDNLLALRREGAVVEYAQADVRDPEALRGVLDGWRARYGPPVGLIHGAGVIQDKLLKDKEPESFDLVVGTKLDGALALARLVDPAALRFAAFFSSVAGRFGNRGQADYAAANDALNKLAVWLDRRWPGRVLSMIWGPWSGVGMVSDLETHLARRGMGMIRPEEGPSRLAEELTHGRKGDVEVIISGDLGNLVDTPEAVSQS